MHAPLNASTSCCAMVQAPYQPSSPSGCGAANIQVGQWLPPVWWASRQATANPTTSCQSQTSAKARRFAKVVKRPPAARQNTATSRAHHCPPQPQGQQASINCQHNHNSNAVDCNRVQWHRRQPNGAAQQRSTQQPALLQYTAACTTPMLVLTLSLTQ